MLLKSLELSNFRGFENISISFNDNLTVVVGKMAAENLQYLKLQRLLWGLLLLLWTACRIMV